MKITQVAAALIWREDKILICRRPANKARALLWEFPGGKVEAGETKQQALVRECREELGITVVPGSVYYEVTHTYPDITIHLTLFNCTTQDEPQRLEHSELAWVLPQNVTAYDFCPADKAIVAKIAAQANAKIKTERLYLRELTPGDEAELKTFLQDEEVMYAWEAPFTDAEVTAWLTENLRRYEADGFSFYAVTEKCSGKFLGVCGPLIETINGERRMAWPISLTKPAGARVTPRKQHRQALTMLSARLVQKKLSPKSARKTKNPAAWRKGLAWQ